jgi:hypothetical protein
MKPMTLLMATLCVLVSPPAFGQWGAVAIADLYGDEVVPPNDSPGVGGIDCLWDDEWGAGYYRLSFTIGYRDLRGSTIGASLHVGTEGENGDLLHVLFPDYFETGAQGELGFLIEDFQAFVDGENPLYVVVETDSFPEGELRGQLIFVDTPTKSVTWGRIRAVYR